MVICDSCKAKDKITDVYNGDYVIQCQKKGSKNSEDADLHLCNECAKEFEKMNMALWHLIRREGVQVALSHLYADLNKKSEYGA